MAYVGPVSLNLRQDMAAKSPGVTEVKHGDRLDIIDVRRRLVRVRTVNGAEGWVDANLLLSAQQMDELRKLAEDSRKLPSQGAATVFEALNMHTEPNRPSPSFHQIPEGGAGRSAGASHDAAQCSPPERRRAGEGGCASEGV